MRRRYRIDVVGAFVAPLALTFLLASRFVGATSRGEPSPRIRARSCRSTSTANLLGVALFTLAFAAAVAYLVQERLLKEKRLDGRLRGACRRSTRSTAPSTASSSPASRSSRSASSPGRSGRARSRPAARPRSRAPRFGYATWLLFAAVLLLRAAAGWRGRRAAYGTIAGFGFAVRARALSRTRRSP